jgi:hypothetical protein
MYVLLGSAICTLSTQKLYGYISGVTGGTVILQIPEVSLVKDSGDLRNSPLRVTLLAFFEKYRKVIL